MLRNIFTENIYVYPNKPVTILTYFENFQVNPVENN